MNFCLHKPSIERRNLARGVVLRDAAPSKRDLTGTNDISVKFWRDMLKRWKKVEALTRDAIATHDLLGITKTVQSIAQGSDKVLLFQRWLDQALLQIVTMNGMWMRPFIEESAGRAEKRVLTLDSFGSDKKITDATDWLSVLSSVAVAELQGVCEAASQQAVRAVAQGLLSNYRPEKIARDVIAVLRNVGETRSQMVVDYMVIKTFAAATLEAFRARGVTHVGTIAEYVPITPSVKVGDAARVKPQKRHGKSGKFIKFTPMVTAWAQRQIERRHRLFQEAGEVDVQTAEDDRVCFPAFTLITTPHGERSIQSINVGDFVLTRFGFKPVISVSGRKYKGRLIAIKAHNLPPLICTPNHPIWIFRTGFTRADEIRPSDIIQLADNKSAKVLRVYDFSLSNANDYKSIIHHVFVTPFVLFLRKFVPIHSVSFNNDFVANQKIDGIFPDLNLINKRHTNHLKGKLDSSLNGCLAGEFSIAGEGAKPLAHSRRANTLFFSAMKARNCMHWPSAIFRAIDAIKPALYVGRSVNEIATASKTLFFNVARISSLAFNGAKFETVSNGFPYFESFFTSLADFNDKNTAVSFTNCAIAHPRAIWPTINGFEHNATTPARNNRSVLFCFSSAFTRAITFFQFTYASVQLKRFIAVIADKIKWHIYPWICRKILLVEGPSVVYNLSVEGHPEYYANGILVHNCQKCQNISDNGPYEINSALSLIPAHPNCRCIFIPAGELDVGDAFDPNEPRDPQGQWTSGGAGTTEPTVGDERVIKVGGDEWNRATARRLEAEYQKAKPSLDKIADGLVGKNAETEVKYISYWNDLDVSVKNKVLTQWEKNNFMHYYDGEVNNWLENGDAKIAAEDLIVYGFSYGKREWAIKALNAYAEDEKNTMRFPFSSEQIASAIKINFEPNTNKVNFEFDNSKLTDPVGFDSSPTLPGIEPQKPEDFLTYAMRVEIFENIIQPAFNEKVTKATSDLKPPSYLKESTNEILANVWSDISDTDKFEEAVAQDAVNTISEKNIEITPYTLGHLDPLQDHEGADYRATQAVAKQMFLDRAQEILKERLGKDVSIEDIKAVDNEMWKDWKDASTSPYGLVIQAAISDELQGRLYLGHTKYSKEEIIKYAGRNATASSANKIGGYEGIKALLRAKWETTQWMLDKADKPTLQLYRAVRRDTPNEPMQNVNGYTHFTHAKVERNGAASTSVDSDVSNGWDGDVNRVVLRAVVPRTAALSVPAYGINVQHEKEVVVAGTAWVGWDAWKGKAPDLKSVPLKDSP